MRDELYETMCECGHILGEHHISWFPNGGMLVEECEYWGSNEHGGGEWIEEEPGSLDDFSSLPTGHWVPHCNRFRRAL